MTEYIRHRLHAVRPNACPWRYKSDIQADCNCFHGPDFTSKRRWATIGQLGAHSPFSAIDLVHRLTPSSGLHPLGAPRVLAAVRHGLSLLRPLAALSQLLTGCTLQLLTPVGGEDVIMHKNVCGWAAVAAAAASAALRSCKPDHACWYVRPAAEPPDRQPSMNANSVHACECVSARAMFLCRTNASSSAISIVCRHLRLYQRPHLGLRCVVYNWTRSVGKATSVCRIKSRWRTLVNAGLIFHDVDCMELVSERRCYAEQVACVRGTVRRSRTTTTSFRRNSRHSSRNRVYVHVNKRRLPAGTVSRRIDVILAAA